MKKLLSILFVLLLAFIGCAKPAPVKAPEVKPDVTTVAVTYPIHFHADTAFTPWERKEIVIAADTWRGATGGLADITVEFDLDMDSIISLKEHATEDLILKIDHESPYVTDENGVWDGTWAFAPPWGGIHNRSEGPLRVFLVYDYLIAAGIFRAVTIHEFGHSLGLSHVESPQAIMYAHASSKDANYPACITQADLSEFCRVNSCGTVKMYSCERK
jgi:hypothetical protein